MFAVEDSVESKTLLEKRLVPCIKALNSSKEIIRSLFRSQVEGLVFLSTSWSR